MLQTVAELVAAPPGHGGKELGGEGEIEGGVQFVIRQVGRRLLHRLDGLGDQQQVAPGAVHPGAQALEEGMGFRQAFAAGAFALMQEGHRIQAEAINAALHPEVDHLQHRLGNGGVVVVEVWLVMQESVQVVLAGHGIPLPVGGFEVAEQHLGLRVAAVVVAPHVEVPLAAAGGRPAGSLKPGMQHARVVEHQIEQHPDAVPMGLIQQPGQIVEVAEIGMNRREIGDVVATVPQR
ncbi:hypothetical protein WH5701_05245 [Synechococcus sp. WH 5701]|nr:hypothetical protein WH5701_05245 [Synechococcus sp. WH 5701]